MPQSRPAIPAELRRAVLVEAGHRCAIPTCRQHPVEIEHIDDWAAVKEHRFENLIALCPTCHARKGGGPGQIDRKSLKQYKANLAILNSRYGEIERRFLEWCAVGSAGPLRDVMLPLPGGFRLLMWNLVRDGHVSVASVMPHPGGPWDLPNHEYYSLTDSGVQLVLAYMQAEKIDPFTDPLPHDPSRYEHYEGDDD